MTLAEFKKEKIVAMKNHDKDAVDALNLIITKVMNLTIEKRAVGQEVTEGDIDGVVQKAVKELGIQNSFFVEEEIYIKQKYHELCDKDK